MAGRTQSRQIAESDFSGLLEALSGTGKGRAFLAEYLRRYRPQETRMLLDALQRIEATVQILRDQVQPERLGSELRRIASTLDIAAEDTGRDNPAEIESRRCALLARASADLTALATSLSAEETEGKETDIPVLGSRPGTAQPGLPDIIEDDIFFLDQFVAEPGSVVDR